MSRVSQVALLIAALAIPVAACGQSVDRLVAAAGEGTVQFHFAPRPGVCGNGRDFFRASESGYYATYNRGDGDDDSCVAGPVRVVLVRDGRDVLRVETYAGPLSSDPDGGHDLGAVVAKDAAGYLLRLAGTLDGRPAREALLPAMLADSAVVTPQLLQLAGDHTRSRDIRASALASASRRRDEPGGVGAAAVQRALDGVIRDGDESEAMRQQALDDVANQDRAAGVPLLIGFAGETDSWVARQAFRVLARSGDPRARQYLRAALHRSDLPDDDRVAAIGGLGGEYATAGDYQLLRDMYPTVDSDQDRNAIINAIANAGGRDNIDWLLALARSPTESANHRRQAVSALSRADDPRVKEALKGMVERE